MNKLKFVLLSMLFSIGLFANSYWHRTSETEKAFSGELSILTFNVCALPGNMPMQFGGMSSADERKEEIFAFLEEQDADLVCLEEVWDPHFREFIVRKLNEKYPHVFYKIGTSLWRLVGRLSVDCDALLDSGTLLDSGLLVATKYPVEDIIYVPYSTSGSYPDNVIHRGVFTCRIGEHKIGVTHLQAGDGSKEIRKQQISEIPEDCEILIGDMNTRGSEELGEFFPNYLNHYRGPATHPEKNRTLDYILTQGDVHAEIESIDTGLSDHLALRSIVKF